jgi:hypothetical protein
MISLKDLANEKIVKAPAHAVDYDELMLNSDLLSFGKRDDLGLDVTYRGLPLIVNIKCSSFVTHDTSLTCLTLSVENDLSKKISMKIYSCFVRSDVFLEMVPSPILEFGLSRLDQACIQGIKFGFDSSELVRRVKCVTDEGNSTSISTRARYETTWTLEMSRILFDNKRVSPESDADFWVCLPARNVCFCLHSPSPNFGRFS